MKKYIFCWIFIMLLNIIVSCNNNSFNPTGTYEYEGQTKDIDGEVYGYAGTIQVKKLSNTKIAMTFYICKGAPSYNSGSFIDTLEFKNNIAIFKENDSCITTFKFSEKRVDVSENNNCYWGGGVVAHGSFKKISERQPVLEDLLTGEKL